MDTPRAERRAMFVLLLATAALVVFTLRPLAVALFLAAVFAVALWPLHNRLTRWVRWPGVSAGLLVLLVIAVVTGPLVGMGAFLVREAADALRFVTQTVRSEGVAGLVDALPDPMERAAQAIVERLGSIQEQLMGQGDVAASAVGAAVTTTGALVFQSVMMLIALFFFLVQKEAILDWIEDASPLRRGQTRELLAEFRRVSGAVLRSTVLTALVQAAAAMVGYLIARVPHPLFFGALTFITAMIPAVGAASVCLLAAGLLLVSGHTVAAIFLAIWGVVVVGLADNIVKPLLIRGGMEMHTATVFFSLIGGLAAFGPIGLLVGPLAITAFIAVLRIYRRDYGDAEPPGGGKVADQHFARTELGEPR